MFPEVRPVRASDEGRLQGVLKESGVFSEEEIGVALELISEAAENGQNSHYRVICAVDGRDTPVGYACYGHRPFTLATYDLYWIAVDPSYQGRGVGRTLLAYLEEELCSEGARLLLIETSSRLSYERARRFYEGSGYRCQALIEDFYAEGDHLVLYGKRLAPPSTP